VPDFVWGPGPTAALKGISLEYINPKPINLAAFSVQVLSFLRFCVFFRVFWSRSLQNRSGTCLNVSGVFFASNLHLEMGKIIENR